MLTAHTYVLVLLSLFPWMSSGSRECILERQGNIERLADRAARATDVPVGLLIAVGFSETHLGCDRPSGINPETGMGNWGAPIDGQHRHTPGTPFNAAHILAAGRRQCGSWEGAALYFRSGRCTPDYPGYRTRASWLYERLERSLRLAHQ